MEKNFVNDKALMDIVNDIQNYIGKTYALSQMEYNIVLGMLRDLMIKRKVETKTKGKMKDIIAQVKEQMLG